MWGTLVSMARNSAGSTIWKILITVLVVLLVLVILTEIGLRWFIGSQLRSGFEQQTQDQGIVLEEEPQIAFSSQPLVWGLMTGNVNEITMDTPSTLRIDETAGTVEGVPSALTRIHDLQISPEPIAGTLITETELPEDYLLAIIRSELRNQVEQSTDGSDIAGWLVDNLGITGITANPSDNALDVDLAQGAVVISLVPNAVDGQLDLKATNTQLFGMDLPPEVSQAISDALRDGLTNQADVAVESGTSPVDATDHLLMESFDVIDGGVAVTVRGEDVPLAELA